MSIYYLPYKEVIDIHDNMIKLYGGSYGIRDESLIRSAIARPKATFSGEDLYTTIFAKAAALFHSLMFNHAFVDGNKRTTVVTTARFLACNGFSLEAEQEELVAFALRVENNHLTVEDITDWLEKHGEEL